ncbi:MAG: hypothetical protein IBX68_08190 [Dehalococcoidia bacterium]|nr:hypothetical protein [Dehalococcoidia bacterium]
MKVVGLVLLLTVLVAAGLVSIRVPLIAYTETYTEAYTTPETYYTTEIFLDETPLTFETGNKTISNLYWRRTSDCAVPVKNTSAHGGEFRVQFNAITQEGETRTKVVWQYLAAGEQRSVLARFDRDYIKEFTCSVEPPAASVESSRRVLVTRDLIRYREVERSGKLTVVERLTGGGKEPAPTIPVPTMTPPPTPTPSPSPQPTTSTRLLDRTKSLSDLSITLSVVSWTGDYAVAEWIVRNPSQKTFAANRLYSIFCPGAVATDQAGNEGEFFVPDSIAKDLRPGDYLRIETKWLFFPESNQVTVRLTDAWTTGSFLVDVSTEFVFAR